MMRLHTRTTRKGRSNRLYPSATTPHGRLARTAVRGTNRGGWKAPALLLGYLLPLLALVRSVWHVRLHRVETLSDASQPNNPQSSVATSPRTGKPQEEYADPERHAQRHRPVSGHLFQRRPDGRWDPPRRRGPKETFRRWTERMLLAGAELPQRPVDGTGPPPAELAFVGLVRTSKTASSSLLEFLHGHLPTYLRSLDYPAFSEHVLEGAPPGSGRALFTACLFGGTPAAADTATVEGPPPPDAEDSRQQELESTLTCPHFSYDRLVSQWVRSLPDLSAATTAVVASKRDGVRDRHGGEQQHSALRVRLDVVTLVREPLDRYESYFYFWRDTYPSWKDETHPLLHEPLEQGRFSDFLERLPLSRRAAWDAKAHRQAPQSATPRWITAMTGAFQFEHFGRANVTEAVEMIEGPRARVVPLVTICFEASLHLLADRFPQHLDASVVQRFLQWGADRVHVRARLRGGEPDPHETLPPPLAPVAAYDATVLRRRAHEEWLMDEYRFYRAAVAQFRRLLDASQVDRPIVEECRRRLDREAQ